MTPDWTAALRTIAPGIAALAGGPLWAGAVQILADKLLGPDATGDAKTDEATIATMLTGGVPPDLRAKIIDAETALRAEALRANVETRRIDADTERAYLADIASARAAHAQTLGVLVLGYLINAASYALIGLVLYGCYSIMAGSRLAVDAATAAMIGSVIGAAVQWLMSNAAQANGFFFGSSPGSRQLASDLGRTVGSAVQSAGGDTPARKAR